MYIQFKIKILALNFAYFILIIPNIAKNLHRMKVFNCIATQLAVCGLSPFSVDMY